MVVHLGLGQVHDCTVAQYYKCQGAVWKRSATQKEILKSLQLVHFLSCTTS